MGKIVVNENISLDGVVEAVPDALLAGRVRLVRPVSGQGPRSVGRGRVRRGAGCRGPAIGSNRLNGLPKYVVSSTLLDPAWDNSMVLKGDVPAIQRSLVSGPPS